MFRICEDNSRHPLLFVWFQSKKFDVLLHHGHGASNRQSRHADTVVDPFVMDARLQSRRLVLHGLVIGWQHDSDHDRCVVYSQRPHTEHRVLLFRLCYGEPIQQRLHLEPGLCHDCISIRS